MLIFRGQFAPKSHPGAAFCQQSAFGAKMGPPPSCIQVVFHRFWAPGRLQNSQKSIKIGIKIGCFFEVPPGRPPEGSWMPN